MNKSSSFYSEAYYQKARKEAYKKKPIYRQRNKQLYDQQHQLEILRYYTNRSGRCEMIRYYQMIAELFFVMKEKNIKGSDEYNQTAKDYIAKVNQRIKYFHQFLECTEFETREQLLERMEQEAKRQEMDVEVPQESQKNIVRKPPTQIIEKEGEPKRLDTCNQCPIFIEEYEFNFQKTPTLIAKQSSYWDKLNGNQKLAKFRRYIQQNLKILKYELENKCEFARKPNRVFGRKMFGRP